METTLSIQMILNEDFFNDIEIHPYEPDEPDEDLRTDAETVIKHKLSEYNSVLMVMMNTYTHCPYCDNEFLHNVGHMTKRLDYMLDAYGMKYSKPFFIDDSTWDKTEYDPAEISGHHIISFDGCNIIVPKAIDNPETIDWTCIVILMFFDMPVFKTVKSGYYFNLKLLNSIWRDSCRKFFHYNVTRISNNKLSDIICFGDYIDWIKINKVTRMHDNLVRLVPDHAQEISKAVKSEREMIDLIKNH